MARTPTRLAYRGGQVGQDSRWSLHGRLRRCVQVVVEVRGDVTTGTPAVHRLRQACLPPGVVFGKSAHEHHPSAAQPLFGGGQADVHGRRDLGDGPAEGVVEDDRQAIDDRQPGQSILELVAQLGAFEDALGHHRVGVVAPIAFDVFDVELGVMTARTIDDPVDEAAPEPGRQGGRITQLVPPTPGPDDGLLGAVLGDVRVCEQAGRQPDQAGQLPGQAGGEGIAIVRPRSARAGLAARSPTRGGPRAGRRNAEQAIQRAEPDRACHQGDGRHDPHRGRRVARPPSPPGQWRRARPRARFE